jgi:hypothetical protein
MATATMNAVRMIQSRFCNRSISSCYSRRALLALAIRWLELSRPKEPVK